MAADETVSTTGTREPTSARGGSTLMLDEVRVVMKVALVLTSESPALWKY